MGDGFKTNMTTAAQGASLITTGARIMNRASEAKGLNVEKVAQDFESFLIFTMMKEMEKTTHVSKKSYPEQTYMSLLYEKMGDYLSKKGLGIKDMLVKYMDDRNIKVSRNAGDNSFSSTKEVANEDTER